MKKFKWILVALLPVQWGLLQLLKSHPLFVETHYSQKLYPIFFKLQAFFFTKLPFSFGDIAYGAAIMGLIIYWVKWFQNRAKRKVLLLNFFATISMVFLLFQLHWGLNYYRLSLQEKLNYPTTYTEKELTETLDYLITSTNNLQKQLAPNDSTAVLIPYAKEKLSAMIEGDFNFELTDFKVTPYLKNSMWSTLLSYMGFAGYLNPLTLESQVNSKIPKLNYCTTAAHEMAHQLGIASETEANFIAYQTTITHPDPFIQFSGYSFALRYCYGELLKANPEAAKEQIIKLNKGVLKNFQELSEFWRKFQNPLEPYFKKGYDTYLKANGQKKGILSYNAMVSMVIAYTLERELASD